MTYTIRFVGPTGQPLTPTEEADARRRVTAQLAAMVAANRDAAPAQPAPEPATA